MKQSEAAEKYRIAGARFANLKHHIELLLAFQPKAEEDPKAELLRVEETWNKVRQESPNLPSRIWREYEERLAAEEFGSSSDDQGKA